MNRLFPLLVLLVSPALGSPLAAQVASERATFKQNISGTEIEIDWSRPSLRGRDVIFGSQVPWGEVWTPGADDATRIRFSKDVVLAGHEVAAGTYSVWIQVVEDEPWQFLLHADTTLFHTEHPTLDEGILHFPLEREVAAEVQESLLWDLDRLRIDGALLVMHWGRDRVSIPLKVDPGIRLTVTREEAAPVVGSWTFDDSMMLPSREEIDAMVAEYGEEVAEYFDMVRAMPRPRDVDLSYDAGSGLLEMVDPPMIALMFGDEAAADDAPASFEAVLLPRGPGFFMTAVTMNGEVAFASPSNSAIVEFEYDDQGRAIRFTVRGPNEEIEGVGERRDR
jgi:hypothetical protein